MPVKFYVLPEEREQLRKEAIKRAITSIEGPVGFYEHWPGEEPSLTITEEVLEIRQQLCRLVWEDETLRERCYQDYKSRVAACTQPQISLCWLGIHNAVCPLKDEHGLNVTLVGGEFLVRERKAEAQDQLRQFLEQISPEQREKFHKAWAQLPEVSEAEVFGLKIRELELAGYSYLFGIKQRSDFRYSADLVAHDLTITLQALIAEIEVLKVELKDAFNIGRKWEDRFETLINICEQSNRSLTKRLDLGKPEYVYHSISKLIHECIDFYVPQAKARGIEFQIDLERNVDEEGKYKVLALRMDRNALRQALRNVIDNAVKYSYSGTADHPRWIEMTGKRQTIRGVSGYSITISNLGIGIEQDELKLVFEPGYQGRLRVDESRSGYGMGLTSVKECIEEHGGNVIIRSHPQQRTGWLTTVQIWLPLHGPIEQHSKEA